jgi:hypothetical protein
VRTKIVVAIDETGQTLLDYVEERVDRRADQG